jgi:acylphosphatase
MQVRAHVFIFGKVQGVFFRLETRYEAKKREVNGWVRNTSDSKVEAVFEGEEDAVKDLIGFCKKGPIGARVTGLKVIWENFEDEFKDFKIRYTFSS